MVAPATLSLGSCAGLVLGQAEKSFLSSTSHRHRFCHSFHKKTHAPILSSHSRSSRSVADTRAVAVDSNQLGSSEPAEKEKSTKYYFVVANAKFMLDEEEHFQELLFEKVRNYSERNKEQDFWLVIEPKFLDKFPNITKRLKRPAVALVSTNATWITFMKLRLDRVLEQSYEADSLEEALASNPTDLTFEKPENWVAPYPKYESGWWEPFLPPESVKAKE
ncbi:YCF54 [Tasmannia lanceolata]|uniref:YCF54 n=1 Tax=Tasmannia lanceolata TaxID=3420 RepID=UPI004063E5D4